MDPITRDLLKVVRPELGYREKAGQRADGRRLPRPTFTEEQAAAQRRVDGMEEERPFHLFLADDGRKRVNGEIGRNGVPRRERLHLVCGPKPRRGQPGRATPSSFTAWRRIPRRTARLHPHGAAPETTVHPFPRRQAQSHDALFERFDLLV